jgi:hypothetical protein
MFSSLNAKDVRETRSWKKDKPTPQEIFFLFIFQKLKRHLRRRMTSRPLERHQLLAPGSTFPEKYAQPASST